ncbi:MAG: serine palmitoyltransferase component [Chaenotheca gracillima]|nr:MAG: serine palmitoyltransferase component [Chaenotheca gracillima]
MIKPSCLAQIKATEHKWDERARTPQKRRLIGHLLRPQLKLDLPDLEPELKRRLHTFLGTRLLRMNGTESMTQIRRKMIPMIEGVVFLLRTIDEAIHDLENHCIATGGPILETKIRGVQMVPTGHFLDRSIGLTMRIPSHRRDSVSREHDHKEEESSSLEGRELGDLSEDLTNVPYSVPYMTPISEFLYGTSTVRAALMARRRKIHKLYMLESDKRQLSSKNRELARRAAKLDVPAMGVSGGWERLMDIKSSGRPHNGFLLDVSPLPRFPVVGLGPLKSPATHFRFLPDHQSAEEKELNGPGHLLGYNEGQESRYPLVLLLEGILDPGNLGAIFRSAYFFGADAIVVSTRNTAPLNAIALKASAGAAEFLPFMLADNPTDFLSRSDSYGWKIYASVVPPKPEKKYSWSPEEHNLREPKKYMPLSMLGSPLQNNPCILMMGSEDEGLSTRVKNAAHYEVGIASERMIGRRGIDCLNVSVAAGLLCSAFNSTKNREAAMRWDPLNRIHKTSSPPSGQEDRRRAYDQKQSSDRLF